MNKGKVVNASHLGDFHDGWADLIEGMGSKSKDIFNEVEKQLVLRNMPDVKIESAILKPERFSKEQRVFLLTRTHPGVTATILIQEYGDDLFTSWRTYIKKPINWNFLSKLATLSFLIAMLHYIVVTGINTPLVYLNYLIMVESIKLVALSLVIVFGLIIFASITGYIIKKDSKAFIRWEVVLLILIASGFIAYNFLDMGEIYQSINEEINTYKANTQNQNSIVQFLSYFFGYFLFFVFITGLLGLLIKFRILYFLIIESNIFDRLDITAMDFSVHKSILRALDISGIDITKLRLKRDFKGGRKDEDV